MHAAVDQPGQQQVERAARVGAVRARVEQRLELRDDPQHALAGERLHDVAHPPFELAHVGHPRVDLGGARLERHPRVGGELARGRAQAGEAAGPALADEQQRLAGAHGGGERRDLGLERVVQQHRRGGLLDLVRAPHATDRPQPVDDPLLRGAAPQDRDDRLVAEVARELERRLDLVVRHARDGDRLAPPPPRDLEQRLERRPAPRLAGPGVHERHEVLARVLVERAQEEDGALPAHPREVLEQRPRDLLRAHPAAQLLERHRRVEPVLRARPRQQRVVIDIHEQAGGAVEALVGQQRRRLALSLRQRPQLVEQPLEVTHDLSAASSS